jgi:hypothetical protein
MLAQTVLNTPQDTRPWLWVFTVRCKCRRKQGVLLAVMAAAVLSGILFGLFAAKLCRAWWDDEAEDARRRFHALYADPAADVEDLPELPTCVFALSILEGM